MLSRARLLATRAPLRRSIFGPGTQVDDIHRPLKSEMRGKGEEGNAEPNPTGPAEQSMGDGESDMTNWFARDHGIHVQEEVQKRQAQEAARKSGILEPSGESSIPHTERRSHAVRRPARLPKFPRVFARKKFPRVFARA